MTSAWPTNTPAQPDRAPDAGFSRLPSLTGLRFVAALLVFVHHSFFQSFFDEPAVNATLQRIGIGGAFTGVGFFFMLSGFVLTWSARADGDVAGFWRRRLVKIYPNHFVTWVLGIVLALSFGTAFTSAQVVPNLFLVNVWAPDPVVLTAINQPSWSLCCELFFYLLFPLLFGLLRRIPEHRLWFAASVVIASIIAVPFLAMALLPDQPGVPGIPASASQWWFVYLFPPVRMLEFVLGILVARIVRSGRWIPVGLATAVPLLVLGLSVQVFLLPSVYGIMAPVAVPLALLIGAAATADVNAAASPFRGVILHRLGELSFALYMVHFLVLWFGKLALGPERTFDVVPAVGLIGVLFLICLSLAWLLFVCVERPMMRIAGGGRSRPSAQV